jgi:hypothetical protein
MSYQNVVGGKLKLKGKGLDVQSGNIRKKKKRDRHYLKQLTSMTTNEENNSAVSENVRETIQGEPEKGEHTVNEEPPDEDHRTAAEKRYHQQKLLLDAKRLKKIATKSHRDRIEDFNQYLANLSEHYDIPKVGPG